MERSLFFICVSLAVSLLIGFYQIWWLFSFCLTGLLLLWAFSSYNRIALYTTVILLTGVLLAGFSSEEIPSSLPTDNDFIIEGIIADYPQNEEDKGKFILSSENKNYYLSKIQVFTAFNSDLQRGDRVALKGSLKPPEPPGNPGQFNYPAYLKYEQIFYTLLVNEPKDIKVLQPAQGINKMVNVFRNKGVNIISTALPPQEAAVLFGMLLGKVDSIDNEQYDDFQKTGVIHIFSVSGLHVGFLLLLCSWIAALLNLSKQKKYIFSLILIALYGIMTGWPVSVIRASLMAAAGLTAYYFGRENQLLNSLGLAGIIILLYDPQAIFEISFQLSFMATFGLVYIFPVLRSFIKQYKILWDLILIPVSAQLAVLPLVAWHFNLFSPISLISNIIITYTAGASVILGFFALNLAQALPDLAAITIYPAGLFIEIIINSNNLFKNMPLAFLWVATPNIVNIVLYYCGLILTICALKGQLKMQYFYTGLFMVLTFIMTFYLPASLFNRGTLEIVFIDVGQGDSTLIKTPQGKFILIDGGGSDFYDVVSTRLMAYLHHRGIREIFMAINTHPDTDHLAGVEQTVKELRVVHIGLPQTVSNKREYTLLRELAVQKNCKIVDMHQGQIINVERDFTIKVLHPEMGEAKASDYNQESLVLLVEGKGLALLLTGDLSADKLKELAEQGSLDPVNIVKVPHHGSRFSLSEAFYQQINPQFAVICVGNNNFGHPHNDVIKSLEDKNIKIMRTDKQGNIYFDSRGIINTFK